MCGIAGLFGAQGAFPDRAEREAILARMTRSLAHRGPDAEGTWHDKTDRCALGHRRLSIIDTSAAGKQPMLSSDQRWVISFNGELYNFQELRAQLQAAGFAFRGRTDTEVLLNALALWGIDALGKLEGMFAFAAFDTASGQLILARDPFGEKPLYYAELPGGGITFASELQALELVPNLDLSVSPDSVAELLMFQYIGAPRTIYRSVKKLPPGHWLVCYPGQEPKLGQYFKFQPGCAGFDRRSISDLANELEEILLRSLRRRLIADVPLGAFLSGGVDSSTVCALITKRLGVPLRTFSIGFEGAPESEHLAARSFAKHLRTEHHEQILTPNTGDFLLHIGQVLDEPNGDSSCLPTYLLSKFARESVTVALSGDGGDEMFVGYGRYFSTLDDEKRFSRNDSKWSAGDAYYSNRILVAVEEHVRELLGHVPAGAQAHLTRLRAEVSSSRPLFCALRATDVQNYMPGAVLPKVDRMSMQHSLEVRTPFLNVELARFAERLPLEALYDGKFGKRVLREISYRYLPRDLVDLPKQGFGLPMSQWAQSSLTGVASELLESDDSRLSRALGREAVQRFMSRQRARNGFSAYQVWTVAMLESWLRHHPARMERLETVELNLAPTQPASGEDQSTPSSVQPDGLAIWPIARNVVLVTHSSQAQLDMPGASEASSSVIAEAVYLLRMAGLPFEPRDAVAPAFVASWSELTSRSIPPDARQLIQDATLLCPHANLGRHLSHAELEGLRAIPVRRLVYRHPHRGDGAVFVLELRRREPIGDFLRARILAKRGVGRRQLSLAAKREGNLRLAGPLSGVPPIESEMSDRFMLFDGHRQLPPFPATHEEIRELGGGRYSVWSRHAFFSRIGSRPSTVWAVELTDDTRDLLPYRPLIVVPVGPDSQHHPFTQDLSAFIENQPAPEHRAMSGAETIVVLTHALPPGGAERQWCYLAVELKRRGFDVRFVTIFPLDGQNNHYVSYLSRHGIEVSRLDEQTPLDALTHLPVDDLARNLATHPLSPFGARLTELTALFVRIEPRAIFAQLDYSNLIAGAAGLLAGVPEVVLSFRNYNPSNFSYLANDWFQPLYATLAKSKRVKLTGNSRAANHDYAGWIGLPTESVALIPNAIDAATFNLPSDEVRRGLAHSLGIEDGSPVLLGVFRLNEEKRPLLFADVVGRIVKRVPQLRAFVAGVGPFEQRLRDRISEHGIENQLTLLGRRNDVFDLMSLSSVVLLTSSFEGMPNVLMEAQLSGTPVVASRVGGVPDCVIEGRTGYIVEPDDLEGFAERCIQLLADKDLRQRMGQEARCYMTEFFSIEAMAARYLATLAANSSS